MNQGEYDEYYKSITKDKSGPMTQTHFIAEGGVEFKSLLFVPNSQPSAQFNIYGQAAENIKLYVRRGFITDDFKDMMPSYPGFVKGVADSDDLPLNVSRETSLSNLFPVMLRWRCYAMALVWDLSKAFHSIHTSEKEKFPRLIVWRSGKLEEKEKEDNVEKKFSKGGIWKKT